VRDMTAQEIRTRVAQLLQTVRDKESNKDSGSTGLFLGSAGTFDSVAGLNLILAIEKEFDITIDDDDIQPENFATLAAIVNYVEHKLKAA
jgi:acyl carrier protein